MNHSRHAFRAVSWALAGALAAPLALGQHVHSVYPLEDGPHEGTWLQWPHRYTYGVLNEIDNDGTWIAMTEALVQSENVHIIVYNAFQRNRVRNLLNQAGVPLTNVDFLIRQTDDCWVRDNGPLFVYGDDGTLQLTDWGFNGWGFDTPYQLDDAVPVAVSNATGIPRIDRSAVVLEGGAIEVDGRGVLMATRSSILEPDRNPGLSQAALERELTEALGIVKFIWLDGAPGGNVDITDTHIDGFARFSGHTIVTMSDADLAAWGISPTDIATLKSATDVAGEPYEFLRLPLTANDVVTTYGQNLGYRGSYVNFYVANTHVLVPAYADPNDAVALGLLQGLYPNRTVVGIDVRNLYASGGMVHCVTQQQPERTDCQGDCAVRFCSTSPNGTAVAARMATLGSYSVAANEFVLAATGVVPNGFGLFVYGPQEGSTPLGNGTLCLTGALVRLLPASSANGAGVSAYAVDLTTGPAGNGPHAITPGSTWKFQYWYREAATSNLTDALSVTFTP